MVHPAEGWGLKAASIGRPGDGDVGIGGRDPPDEGRRPTAWGNGESEMGG